MRVAPRDVSAFLLKLRYPLRIERIKKSQEFQEITKKGRRTVTRGFVLLACATARVDSAAFGITASRKLGGAVQRNRIKRRIRSAAYVTLPLSATPGWGYVFIGRQACANLPFPLLIEEMKTAIGEVSRVPAA
jgi:ribonuclease P protein component